MNVAVIIAGGSGKRTGQDIPKQFITVNDKPIIVYTLENFEKNDKVDEIVVVCIEGWENYLSAISRQFGISKLAAIVPGGASGQESIFNGVKWVREKHQDDTCVIIHDAIRPMVDFTVLDDVIEKCHTYGNGVTSLPYNEQIFVIRDEATTDRYIPRETLRRVSTPQAYRLDLLYDSYVRAFREGIGIGPSSYTNTMMADLGVTLYFAKGSDKNIKITTVDDLRIFRALMSDNSRDWLKQS